MLVICGNNNRNYVCMYVCITLGLEGQSYDCIEVILELGEILFDHVCMYVYHAFVNV
jgi:hypothetical protein